MRVSVRVITVRSLSPCVAHRSVVIIGLTFAEWMAFVQFPQLGYPSRPLRRCQSSSAQSAEGILLVFVFGDRLKHRS